MESEEEEIEIPRIIDPWAYPILVGEVELIFEEPDDPISIAIHKEGDVRCLTCNIWVAKEEREVDLRNYALAHAELHAITFEENGQSDLVKHLKKRIKELDQPPVESAFIKSEKAVWSSILSGDARHHVRQMWMVSTFLIFGIALSLAWDWLNLNDRLFPWLTGLSTRILIEGAICVGIGFISAIYLAFRPLKYKIKM